MNPTAQHRPAEIEAIRLQILRISEREKCRDESRANEHRIAAEERKAIAQRETEGERVNALLSDKMLRNEALTGVNLNAKGGTLRNLETEIAAYPSAKSRAAEETAKRQLMADEARAGLVAPVLRWAVQKQGVHLDRLRTKVADLVEDMIDLAAVDLVRSQLIGDAFALPEGVQAPIAGARAVARLLAGVPQAFRPPVLDDDRIQKAAAASAAQILSQIKEF